MSIFNFTVLSSYRAICVFLVQTFSRPVALHGHATQYCYINIEKVVRLLYQSCRMSETFSSVVWFLTRFSFKKLDGHLLFLFFLCLIEIVAKNFPSFLQKKEEENSPYFNCCIIRCHVPINLMRWNGPLLMLY